MDVRFWCQAHRTYLREAGQRIRAAEREEDVRALQSATEERLRRAPPRVELERH
ncbi:hypothetical protein J7E96_29780 [Streptomyces sp. ISL-96]|uniref:hypothetical protein n=1 Tax=Streptomyces sp. ISL-96 TaxID=2819191 RepID=UPI001BE89BE1|nr:hypothetical protein [Streptomyces sp. ISL-96]MBT2492626.1 hypothetical protein [Streptomyces sp. ISL-96]